MREKTAAHEIARRWHYMTNAEIDLLISTIESIPDAVPTLVNIGAGAGTSGVALRCAKPEALLYTVDISPGGPNGGLAGERHMFTEFNMRQPIQILGDSYDVGMKWQRRSIHAVFIDGDHSEEGVHRDITAWGYNVCHDGYMIFHDYGSNDWPKVKELADRLMQEFGYTQVAVADTLAVYRKSEQ